MRRYIALQKASFQGSVAYRGNVVMMVLTGAFWQGGALAIVLVVLAHFREIAGWDFRDVMFLYGLRLMGHALWLAPLGSLSNFDWVVQFGDFDQMLLRPMNVFVQAVSRPRYLLGIGDSTLALGVFITSLFYARVHWTVAHVGLCAAFILAGALIESSVWVVVSALSFRLTTTAQIGQMTDGAVGAVCSYPFRIFTPDTQRALTLGIPLAFVAYLGAARLLGKTQHLVVPGWAAYLAPAVGALCFSLAFWLWCVQARHYQSTGQ